MVGGVNLLEDRADVVADRPVRIVFAEPASIGNPPDVVAGAVLLAVGPVELLASDLLADLDRFEHRAVAVAPAAHVVDLARARGLEELPERRDQIGAMDVVPDLLSLVAEYRIGRAGRGALHQVGEE